MAIGSREVAATGLRVSPLGLGCLTMNDFYGAGDEAEGERAIRRALDLGVTLVDTADVYGGGANEELVGRSIRARRDQVVVATSSGTSSTSRGTTRRWTGDPRSSGRLARRA